MSTGTPPRETGWKEGPDRLQLDAGALHIWRTELDLPGRILDAARQPLCQEERERADRFIRPIHGARFTVARAALRVLIGRYLKTDPAAVEFRYNEDGKPYLSNPAHELAFNVSHSESLALLAFARCGRLGIDIEAIRGQRDLEPIARRFFSPMERERLFSLPDDQRCQAFYDCWTRKEAYIKAEGGGLSIGLDSFDVSLAPGEPARLLEVRGNENGAGQWSLRALQPGEGYAAAVAIDREPACMECWRFDAGQLVKP